MLTESQGQGSLMGCRLWGSTESDTTEATQQQQTDIIVTMVKNLCACLGETSYASSIFRSGRSPGVGHGNPLHYFLPAKSYGQRILAGHSPWGHSKSDLTEHTCRQKELISLLQFKPWVNGHRIVIFTGPYHTRELFSTQEVLHQTLNTEKDKLDFLSFFL